MQNTSNNSNTNAGGANDLTSNPGNGLTIDVKLRIAFTPEQCLLYDKLPYSSVYEVTTDKMHTPNKDAIFEKDDLTAAAVLFSEVQKGKLYIVEDCKGNIYLGRAKSKRRGDLLTLIVSNPNYEPTVILIKKIKCISLVYSLCRQLMSNERLAELI